MKGVTPDVISEVRLRANILDVISEHVVLKRTGKEHKGLCPFHKEKSPSFNVNPDKGIFKCFGCGEGGDVFAFVQKIKGLDFIDCVRDLAHRYGVQLVESHEERQEYDKRSQIRTLYEQACHFFQSLLADPTEGHAAREYLKGRGIDQKTIEEFRLGFAPPAWDGLLSYLTSSQKVSPALLERAGLVREKQGGGSYYDLFRNRLIVPIADSEGRVIAFGGRALGDDPIKYLNSPETPIYTKGEHLFAFNLAKEHIKERDSVIVVEGYFDAITPHQFGFRNTVATLGTALTESQARLLVRYTDSKRVYLSFDADDAGQKAVDRGVETLGQVAEGVGLSLRIISVPGGKDPDECLRSGGDEGAAIFQQAIDNAALLVDYRINRAIEGVNLESHTGRIEGAAKVVPVLGHIKNAIARTEYIRQVASRLSVGEEELLADVRTFRRANRLDTGGRNFYGDRGHQGGGGFQRGGGGGGNFQKGGFQKGGFQKRQGGGGNFQKGGSSGGGSRNFNNSSSRGHGASGGGGGRQFNNSGGGPGRERGGARDFGNNRPAAGRSEPMPDDYPFPDEPDGEDREVSRGRGKARKALIETGLMRAERQLLAHYLVSREDHERVFDALKDERLMTREHQEIKEAIEGIGTQFTTIEDLQFKLQDRVAPDNELSSFVTEIILKVEDIRRQNLPVDVVLKDCKAKILKERLSEAITRTFSSLKHCTDDAEADQLQCKYRELTQLNRVELNTIDDINDLRQKLDALEVDESPRLETRA